MPELARVSSRITYVFRAINLGSFSTHKIEEVLVGEGLPRVCEAVTSVPGPEIKIK